MAAVVNYFPALSGGSGSAVDKNMGDVAAFVRSLDSTLVATPFTNDCWLLTNDFDLGAAINTGAVVQKTNLSGGVFQVQSGATASSFRVVRNKNGLATPASVFVPSVQTSKWAAYTRVRIEATTATCTLQCCEFADEATFDCFVGVLGATSTTNFSFKVGAAAAVNTGVAFGSTFHDLLIYNDTTNIKAYVDFLTSPTSVGSIASSNAGNVPGHWFANAQNGATAANAEFSLDRVMIFTALET